MTNELFSAVDTYLEELFGPEDPALAAARARADAAGLPQISVAAAQGRLLHVLALCSGARTILEIGTLGGYSAIWLARALPADGHLLSLEYEPAYAEVARRSIAEAGVAARVEIRVGRALDTLAELARDGAGPFDMVFIDADKPPYTEYLDAVMPLVAPGGVIVADNVVRGGTVMAGSDDAATVGIRRFNAAVAVDPRLTTAFVQQVGAKGHDGMAIAVVR